MFSEQKLAKYGAKEPKASQILELSDYYKQTRIALF